jgi:voltage-gated potassium channel Kch
VVLLLLLVAVFFSVSAPEGSWSVLLTTVLLAFSLAVAMRASGARARAVRMWWAIAALGVGASVLIASTQDARAAGGYLALTSLLLTVGAIGAIVRRLRLQTEISLLTVMGAVCIYVLLGLSLAFVSEAVGELGSRPFFASQPGGTRGDYVYFSFVTMATVGYGDLAPQSGLARALAVTGGLIGQIYLVTAVAALVGNLGRRR